MTSPGDNKMSSSGPSNKSPGNYRGGYHNRNTPYSRRPPPRNSRENSRERSRHFHHRSEEDLAAQVDNDFPKRGRDLDMVHGKTQERKFNGHCRLYVGNIPLEMTDDEFKKLFEPYGETREAYLGKGFAFIKLETRQKGEEARAALDGQPIKGGRTLRVKWAGHNAALRIKYLPTNVSNEMLENTFNMFGEVERAVVVLDKNKPTGEAIVEFCNKKCAMNAVKRISEGIFFLTAQPRPISAELVEHNDESDGLPEASFIKTQELLKDREKPPRFAQPGSFEYVMGEKWKKLYQIYREQEDLLKKNFAEEVAKLEMDQETTIMEQHTLMLKQDIQRRQEELRMLEEQTQMERRKIEMRNKISSNPGLNPLDRHPQAMEDMRHRVPGMPEPDNRRRPDDMLRRQMEVAKNSPNEPFFGVDLNRGSERQGLAPPLQPPPMPPGGDRVRMGGLNILNNLGSPLGAMNSPGNLRLGLPRPPMPGMNQPLLMDPSMPMRPTQGVRFDAPQSLGPAGGNLFGLRPGTGPGLLQGPSDGRGPANHLDAKRTRRI